MKIKQKVLINCSFPLNPISLFIKSPRTNESKVSWDADVQVVDSIYDSKITSFKSHRVSAEKSVCTCNDTWFLKTSTIQLKLRKTKALL